MSVEYQYSISGDFSPAGVDIVQLQEEILNDPSITVIISYIYTNGDALYTVFPSALSAPEKTSLDTVIANHIPNNISNFSITQTGYIQLNSTLADSTAIRINASDTAGGIDIDAGSGGIAIDTTNAISLDANAESNFTTASGNLLLRSVIGTTNIDGGAGINIGSVAEAQPINIGTPASARTITIGNQTSTSQTNILTGTGGFNVDTTIGGTISLNSANTASNFTLTTSGDAQDLTLALLGSTNSSIILTSQGTGADAIKIETTGGIDVDATGTINIASASSTGGAITLDTAFSNGGINISSGTQGIAINSNGGLIGIGNGSGGEIQIGTAGVSRTITIGNTTGTTAVNINSGTFGITIGNNANGGEIQIGNVANAKTITLGNNTGASRLFSRWGTGGNIKFQGTETSLANANATLTITNLLTQILTIGATANRTLTLPTASDVVSGISGVQVNDCIDFTIIHTQTGASDPFITLSMGTGGTEIGYMLIQPRTNNAGTYFNSGSATFRLRITNITSLSESYTVYRIS